MRVLLGRQTKTLTLNPKEICPVGNCGKYEQCSKERASRAVALECDLGDVPLVGLTAQPGKECTERP